MTFASRKFIGFLAAATLVIVAEYVLVLSDCVIAGRVLGEEALSAVNLMMPVFSAVSFFTWLLALGTSIVYSDALARMDKAKAAQLAGQGLVAAIVMGILLIGATLMLEGPYLSFMSPDAETMVLCGAYWRWYPLVVLLEAVDLTILYLIYTDGGERTCLISYCLQVMVNVFLSYGLCAGVWGLPALGIAGISLGTVIAYVIGILALVPRLLNRKVCGIRFDPRFLPRDLIRSLTLSFGDASSGLCQALLFFVITKYVIRYWGSDMLPVATVVFCIVRLTVFFNGVGIALQPLETIYHGEGNDTGIRRLLKFAAFVSIAEGLLISAVVFLEPNWIIGLVGIDDPELLDAARHAARLTVEGLSGYAIAYLLNSHYQFVGRPDRSIRLTALAFFIVPAALLFALGRVFGADGVWLALAAGPALAVTIFLLLQHRSSEKSAATLMWSLRVGRPAENAEALSVIEQDLSESLPPKVLNQVTDVLGMALKHIWTRNRGRRVEAEVTVKQDAEGLRVIIRDDGELFALDELGFPVIHLPAAGFNRNMFLLSQTRKGEANPYEVIRGNAVSLEEVMDVVKLDDENYSESCYHKSAGYNYALFRSNPESGIAVRDRRTGAVVGYAMLLPISESTYQKIRCGTLCDSELTPDMVVRYGEPGIYHLYFASVVVHPQHRSARMVLTMLDAMVEDFLSLADRGIFIDRMVADVVSRDGMKFCRLFGLDRICDSDHGSTVYEVSTLPPLSA